MSAGPSQEEMAEGHLFIFEVSLYGVSRVVGDPTYHQAPSDPAGPMTVQVRAHNLRDACVKASQVPLHRWGPWVEEAED